MSFQKGHERFGGRAPGTPNKFTGSAKEAILEVFERMGGVEGLYEWAAASEKNQRIFYTAFMKMAPREVFLQNGEMPDNLPFRLFIEGQEDQAKTGIS